MLLRDFLQMIQMPQHRDEVLILYFTAKRNYRSASYYAFRGRPLSPNDELEIDFRVSEIGAQYEAELQEQLEAEYAERND